MLQCLSVKQGGIIRVTQLIQRIQASASSESQVQQPGPLIHSRDPTIHAALACLANIASLVS